VGKIACWEIGVLHCAYAILHTRRRRPGRRSRAACDAWARGGAVKLAQTAHTCLRARLFPPCRSAIYSALLTCLLATSSVSAQTPFVIDEWKFGRRQEASTLHYCVDARDPDFPVARKIGAAIASALLLQGREHLIGENVVGESIDSLYRVFLETCDVYLGFKLIPGAYPEWMKVTRPYYRTSYLLAATNAGWRSLADVPKTQAIGSTMGTSADLRLIQYLQALGATERWTRFPMGTDEAALKALVSGTVGVALVWGPALWLAQRSDPALAGVRVIAPSPLAASTMDVGAAVLANESFLRSNLDQAIASLVADGTIQRILDDNKFPATAPK
jgi:polar amino acid transport system substrate-binding protein